MAAFHAIVLGVLGSLLSLGSVADVGLEGALSTSPQAQLGVQPNPILTTDQNATIAYQNPDRANQIVIVDIDDGTRPNPRRTTVEIALDGNGYGKVEWKVPNWDAARFNAPEAQEQARAIVPLM